jgi:phosphoketolase
VAPRRRSSVLFRIPSRLIHDSWTVVVCLNDLMTTTAIESRHGALSPAELEAINAWWRAANYLSVGQIYLLANASRSPPSTSKPRPGLGERAVHLRQEMVDERLHHRAYTREFGDDPADVREWAWPAPHA